MSLVVFAQVDYMLNKDLGFVKERILVIRRPDALKDEIDNFKKEILRFPNIESVANSNSIPGRDFQSSTFTIEGDSAIKNILMNHIFVNYDFQKTFGLSLAEGRFFSPSIDSDNSACVINETAARAIKQVKITGRQLIMPGFTKKEGKKFQIIGIVKDFNFETVDKEIEPLVILIMPGNWEGYLNVRINANNVDKTIKHLENTWSKYTKEYPFLYFFLNQDYDRNYRSVIRTGRVLLIFAFLSIFLACLGLFGLVSFTSNQRIREIGIRKAVGATYYQIIILLIKESLLLILVASFFAWVAAYLFSKIWLKEFYSRITLSPMYFILASLIVLTLAILVVLYQSYLAARRDPGMALKAE
jgi:putative ABC transport system permease protein